MIYTKTQPTHQSMPQSRIRDLGHDLLTGRGRFGTLMGSLLLPIDPLLLISMNPLLLARTRHHLRVRGFWRAAQRALPRVRQVLEGDVIAVGCVVAARAHVHTDQQCNLRAYKRRRYIPV